MLRSMYRVCTAEVLCILSAYTYMLGDKNGIKGSRTEYWPCLMNMYIPKSHGHCSGRMAVSR